jgi:hypothetical protein
MTTEFAFDLFDLDLTDEELAVIFDDGIKAGTWEGFESPSPW